MEDITDGRRVWDWTSSLSWGWNVSKLSDGTVQRVREKGGEGGEYSRAAVWSTNGNERERGGEGGGERGRAERVSRRNSELVCRRSVRAGVIWIAHTARYLPLAAPRQCSETSLPSVCR